jgi:integrase
MPDKRVTVWVCHFKDRASLMLQWLDPDTGRTKSRSAKTADDKEAEKARADLEYELNNGRYQEASRLTWERFRELFENEYVASTRLDTQRNYQATFDLFERLCNPRQLKAISERTISLFAAGMRKEPGRAKGSTGMMASTIKVRLQFLHSALTWAAGQKMLAAVPKFPTVKVPQKDPQPIPPETFERLVEKAPDDTMRVFLLCGWLAGLRLSEALQLEWEAVDLAPYLDLSRNRIVLPALFVKAVKDQWLPLDPDLRAALERLPRTGKKVFNFPSKKGGRPLTRMGVSLRIRVLARKAGIRLTMKSLRRGFGCYYANRVSAHVLQKLMRHANIKTTMAYYANVDAAVEEAVFSRGNHNSFHNSAVPSPKAPFSADDVNLSPVSVNAF